jgi:hypothetical protein
LAISDTATSFAVRVEIVNRAIVFMGTSVDGKMTVVNVLGCLSEAELKSLQRGELPSVP